MKNFDAKTQGYIDKTLQTLNTWFGGGGNTTQTPSGGNTTPPSEGNTTPPINPRPKPQQDDNKPKTGLYIGVGLGVLAIVGVTFYLIKRKK
jgi:hypothetical protein